MRSSSKESPELSPDLEWMLQSNQASRAALAEMLVSEFYGPVHQLALSILAEEGAAAWATRETFRSAVARADQYRGQGEIGLWLHRLTLEACQKLSWQLKLNSAFKTRVPGPSSRYRFGGAIPRDERDVVIWRAVDGLNQPERLPALLYYVGSWTVPEIVRLLGVTENEVGRRLGMARDRLTDALTYTTEAPRFNRDELEAEVRRSLQRRWPAARPAPEIMKAASAAAAEEDAPGAGRKPRRPGALREALWIWIIAVLAIGLLWGSNRLLAVPEPTRQPPARPAATKTPAPAAAAAAAQAGGQNPSPGVSSTPSASPLPPAMMDYFVEQGDTLRSLAAQFGISIEELQELNHLPPDGELEPNSMIQVPIDLPEARSTPTPLSKIGHHLPPLDPGASSGEIYARLLASEHLWNTLWVDGRVIDHGALGYAGPPISARLQVWVAQPSQSLELFGPVEGDPRDRFVTRDGLGIYPYPGGVDYQTRSAGFLREASGLLDYSYGRELIFPSFSTWMRAEGRFQSVGVESSARRTALTADWYDGMGVRRRRLWIDVQTGVVLRLQEFDRRDGLTLTWEVQFLDVQFDRDFPAGIFDPLRAGRREFSMDYRGEPEGTHLPVPTPGWSQAPGHEALPYMPAPPGFDPTRSRLTFQYQLSLSGTPNPAGGGMGIDLFADQFYLGSLDRQDPRNALCARSDDGKWVALFTSRHYFQFADRTQESGLGLVLFNLRDFPSVRTVAPDQYVYDFAFATDTSRLAIAGSGRDSANTEVDVLDIEDNTLTRLIELDGYATSLVWSPDGQYLALLGSDEASWQPEALVVRVRDGQIVYRTPVDPGVYSFPRQDPAALQADPDWPAPDWPARAWDVEFPVFERGLGDCVEPPAERPSITQ